MRLRGRAAAVLGWTAALSALLAGAGLHAQSVPAAPATAPPPAEAPVVVTPVTPTSEPALGAQEPAAAGTQAPAAEGAPQEAAPAAPLPAAAPAPASATPAPAPAGLQTKPAEPPEPPAAPPAAPAAAPPAEAAPGMATPPQPAAAPQSVAPEEPPQAESAPLPAAPPPGPRIDPREDTGPVVRPPVQSGDQWMYRRSNGRVSMVLRQSAQRVSAEGIALRTELDGSPDSSTALYTREWNLVASGYNDYMPALRYYAFPLYVGKRWSIDSALSNFGAGQIGRVKGEAVALRWERIEVPAGRFLALRIELDMETADPGDAERKVRVRETHWYARTVLRAVKVESHSIVGEGVPTTEIIELMAYRME